MQSPLALQPQIAEQFAAMPGHSEQLGSKISNAVADGRLMESAPKNMYALLDGGPSDLYSRSVGELVSAIVWSELNDRLYRRLSVGPRWMRGRAMGTLGTTPA